MKDEFLIITLCLITYDFTRYTVILIYFIMVQSHLQIPKHIQATLLPWAFIVACLSAQIAFYHFSGGNFHFLNRNIFDFLISIRHFHFLHSIAIISDPCLCINSSLCFPQFFLLKKFKYIFCSLFNQVAFFYIEIYEIFACLGD